MAEHSQMISDLIAMANALDREDEERYLEVAQKYGEGDTISLEMWNESLSLLVTLMRAVSQEMVQLSFEELGEFILMESFKHELFGGNSG